MAFIPAEEGQGRTLRTFMPSIGLLGENRNGVTTGTNHQTCVIIPGPGLTLSSAAGSRAEAATLRPGCQLEGMVPLRKPQHAGFVLKEWILCTQKSSSSPKRERRGLDIYQNSS